MNRPDALDPPTPDVQHAPQPDAEGLAEPLRSRWSPSVFDENHRLDAAEITTLLQAAQWAPSRGNTQPWGFLVLSRGSAGHARFVEHLSRGNAGWVPRASLVLIGGTDVSEPDTADYARYDLGQAVAHLTLQAQASGLHTHQFAGYDHSAVAAAFEVPPGVQLMAGIAVGRHGDPAGASPREQEREARPRTRAPLSEMAYEGSWGAPWAG